MKLIAALAVLFTAVSVFYIATAPSALDAEFTSFMNEFGKSYNTQEELEFRRQVFSKNMDIAQVLNQENPEAKFGATMFADRTQEEMSRMMGLSMPLETPEDYEVIEEDPSVNGNYDWSTSVYMNPIQNQGN